MSDVTKFPQRCLMTLIEPESNSTYMYKHRHNSHIHVRDDHKVWRNYRHTHVIRVRQALRFQQLLGFLFVLREIIVIVLVVARVYVRIGCQNKNCKNMLEQNSHDNFICQRSITQRCVFARQKRNFAKETQKCSKTYM